MLAPCSPHRRGRFYTISAGRSMSKGDWLNIMLGESANIRFMLELAECMSGSGCMSGIGMLDSRIGIGIAAVGRPRVNSLTRQSARSKASRACPVPSSSSIIAANRSITVSSSLPPSTSAICAAVALAALSGRDDSATPTRTGRLGADCLARGPLSRTWSLSKKKVRVAAIRFEILLRLPMPRVPPLLEGARGRNALMPANACCIWPKASVSPAPR
mmetsp:Transcript_47507/g.113988  ORF Transcript_47507/g.113988 Transcript_47507/m.113988 type:complete len:216 (+) Transcript_47507:124-771(+)